MTRLLPSRITRRRVLTILGGFPCALASGRAKAERPSLRRFVWRGTALGATAEIFLYHAEQRVAAAAVQAAQAEIDRLEAEFSLFRTDSALSRLNRRGYLSAPSLDFRHLIREALRWSELTDGAFDITVQPLWRLYADHFITGRLSGKGPDPQAIARVLSVVNHKMLDMAPTRITLAPGMAVTLNGIAQGYITDRVADLLRERGWSNVLVGLGEYRAVGRRGDGQPWNVGIPEAGSADRLSMTIQIVNRAVATSSGSGLTFEASGFHHHLFSTATGLSANTYASITVVADRATTADALSTSLFVLPPTEAQALVTRVGSVEAWLTHADRHVQYVTS